MTHLIKAQDVSKRFGPRQVLQRLYLEILKGEVVALIGPNGAGKTTTLSILLGMQKADEGAISYWRPDYRAHVGVQLQTTPFFEGYTAQENLQFFAALYGQKPPRERLDRLLNACGLWQARHTPAVRLSLGQQKRLAIAVTTLHEPDLIILDEPTAGLDPLARRDIRDMILSLRAKGITVLLTSHDLSEVRKVADRLLFLHRGKIAAEGSPTGLMAAYNAADLDDLYLKITQSEAE